MSNMPPQEPRGTGGWFARNQTFVFAAVLAGAIILIGRMWGRSVQPPATEPEADNNELTDDGGRRLIFVPTSETFINETYTITNNVQGPAMQPTRLPTPVASANASGTNSVALRWTYPLSDAIGIRFDAQYRRDGFGEGWERLPSVDGSERSRVVGGLNEDTSYLFQVRAVKEGALSEWSEIARAKTARRSFPIFRPPVQPPAPPIPKPLPAPEPVRLPVFMPPPQQEPPPVWIPQPAPAPAPAPVPVQNVDPSIPSGAVLVFEGTDYTGRSWLLRGNIEMMRYSGQGDLSGRIKSVKVGPNTRVALFTHEKFWKDYGDIVKPSIITRVNVPNLAAWGVDLASIKHLGYDGSGPEIVRNS